MTAPETLLTLTAELQPDPYTDAAGVGGLKQPRTDSVTGAPDHIVGVVLSLTAPPCKRRTNGPMQFGGAYFNVRTLGVSTTQFVLLFLGSTLTVPGLDTHGNYVGPAP